MNLFEILQNTTVSLEKQYEVLIIEGADSTRFLNGQLTNDCEQLKENSFQLQSRLDRGGKLKTFFYLCKISTEKYFVIIPCELTQLLVEDLERYIIMDEVEIRKTDYSPQIIFSAYKYPEKEFSINSAFKGTLGDFPATITFDKCENLNKLSWDTFENVMVLQGEPLLGVNVKLDVLVTDSIINLKGVSLKKGCFLGQETVAKIETRRGGAYFPVIITGENTEMEQVSPGASLKVEDRQVGKVLWKGMDLAGNTELLVASLLRDYRVNGRQYTFSADNLMLKGTIKYIPFEQVPVGRDLTEGLFEKAVKIFHDGDNEKAIKQFEEILKIDPQNEDSFEAIGVIFGRMEKYNEGIEFMNKLLEANPNSVMAHTNKSLYFMKLGEIEKAEEEKAQATVKSFGLFGEEAQNKKRLEEQRKQEEAEIQRRFEMFQQVLEIDPEDTLANYGLADIYYHRGEPEKSIELLQKVLGADEKYSVAYLLLGKALTQAGKLSEAKNVYEKGIIVASKKGDLMPANEMQSKLLSLN